MKEFYTIMEGNNFINSNFMKDNNENISEAIRFNTLESAKYYFEDLRKDRGFKIVKVKCTLEYI